MTKYRVGLFGGTFDPVHYGHLLMASYVYDELQLDKFLFMPTGTPPHKTRKITDENIRTDMIRVAIKDDPRLDICEIELGGESPDYTYNTLKKLMEMNPDTEYYFVIGGDSLRNISSWYKYKELLQLVYFVVIDRISKDTIPLTQIIDGYSSFAKGIYYIEMPRIEVSSTIIRDRVKNKKSIKYMTDANVNDIINKYGLYND